MKYFSTFLLGIFSISTLTASFILKFDISGGGSSNDLATHWGYIQILSKDINNLFQIKLGQDFKLLNFPLHHLIFSRFDYITSSIRNYLVIFFIISILLPIIFFINCKIYFKNLEIYKIIFLTFLIYLLPNFQASAIWGNNHITALIFFLMSIYFLHYKFLNEKKFSKKKIFLILLFLSLSSYTRQYYIIFFPFFLAKIYINQKYKNIIFIFFTLLILGFPGLIFTVNNPNILFGLKVEITDFKSSIIIVLSIISFYLIPFFVMNLKDNFRRLNFSQNKNIYIYWLLPLTIIFIFICFNFNYEGTIGGGIFLKVSTLILHNNIILFIFSYIGLLLIFFYGNSKIDYLSLIVPLVLAFSSGFFIFQKYFEPLLIFIFIFLFDKNKIEVILSKNFNILLIYFSFYWLLYFLYSIKII